MMTDRDALYRAILDHPDDNTPRLIFADIVEEDGDPSYAAFIRAQVALAGVPEYDPLWVRTRYFEPQYLTGEPWMSMLPALPPGLRWLRSPFRRGLPAAVFAEDPSIFADLADKLYQLAPVEELTVPTVRAMERELAECPWLNRLTKLTLPAGVGQASARWILNSTLLHRLTDLNIGSGLTTPEAVGVIFGSRAFARLKGFSCRDDSRRHAVVNALARLADPPLLERLDLGGNHINVESLERLADAPALTSLVELDLSDNNLRVEGFRALATAHLPALQSLSLHGTWPEAAGVHALVAAPFAGQLRSLTLADNNLRPRAAERIAEGLTEGNLRVLNLRSNQLGSEGAEALADSSHLRNLVLLDLAHNLINDAGADALVNSRYLDGLIALDVSGNLFSLAAATRLRERFGDRVIF